MVYFLVLLSIIMYVFVIIKLFSLLKLKFYPSYSGFTFPLVISGISIKLANVFLTKMKHAIPFLKYLIKFEEAAAVLIVLYVLIRYIQFLSIQKPSALNSQKTNL
jgi:exfoliative toxin A/B